MKSISKAITGFAMAVVLAGCKDKAQEQKIAALEARLATAEATATFASNEVFNLRFRWPVVEQVFSNTDRIAALENTTATNTDFVYKALLVVRDCADRIANLEAATNRLPRAYAQTQVRPRVVQTMKEGVPLDVYNGIAAEAAQEWPTDYHMQAYEIKKQLDAYKLLHP